MTHGSPEPQSGAAPAGTTGQAVNVAVNGGDRHRIAITTNQAQHGNAGTAPISDSGEAVRWSRRQTYWTIAGIVIALVALYFAYRQVWG
ncbi:hypothetical protein AB0M79_28530 [Polymorphospora sp. NPDC051019]|uniref:hypothetical protein n=1 Tax=Polymorphospora sp. NPDC051019 TaxID=3155725 RepID=UPI0034341E7C